MNLDTTVVTGSPESLAAPLLILLLPQGDLPASLAGLDRAAGGAITRVVASADFTAKKDETALLYPGGSATRLLLIGLGKLDQITRAVLRRGAAIGAKRARLIGVPNAALWAPPEARGSVTPRELGQVLAEGAAQGAWYYSELKRPPEDPKPQLGRIDFLVGDGERAEFEAGHRVGVAIGAGHRFCREIQVLPGNVCTPAYLGGVALDLAKRHGFEVTVMDRAAIESEGLHALLAVAQGSALEPRFIALEYRGGDGAPIVLVGKGVTFDTGGISIKPAQSMEEMKFDKSGAAAVLGTFETLGRLRPKARVVGLIASAENMPSGLAYRPGDVVKSHLGKTIEVVNTDAEGRLLLGDALSYARRYQPACALDIATLTGAITICLGHTASGVMGNDPALIQEVIAAGQRAHERAWELPLWEEYKDHIKSDIADLKNSGGRPAGSITAAWFLREFVDSFSWAHLDVAGTAYTDRDDAALVRGPTGVGVRLFSEFILGRAALASS